MGALTYVMGRIQYTIDCCALYVFFCRFARVNVLSVFSTTILLILFGVNLIKHRYMHVCVCSQHREVRITICSIASVFVFLYFSAERVFDPPVVST